MSTCGIVCDKDGFGMTVVDGEQVVDVPVKVPTGLRGERLEALAWLVAEAERQLANHAVTDIRMWAAAGRGKFAASAERVEVETCVKIAAAHRKASLLGQNKEQLRAAFGLEKGTGAFDVLLERPEVRARGPERKQHQFLLATAPET